MSPDIAVRQLRFSSEYTHVKERKDKSGVKLLPMTNVYCEVMVNFLTQVQECIAFQVTPIKCVIKKIYIKWNTLMKNRYTLVLHTFNVIYQNGCLQIAVQ